MSTITSRRFKVWLSVFSSALFFQFACGGGSGDLDALDGTQGGDLGESDATNNPSDAEIDLPPVPMGNAGLTFRATLGAGFKTQFDAGARPFIPEDTSQDRGDLLLLLCDTSDVGCKNPEVRAIDKSNPDEWPTDVGGPAPLQPDFGPTITVRDLPAGEYDLMIVYDSLDSQRRGHGWRDDFDTLETDWGGLVSATDLMLSDQTPSALTNPPPVPVRVRLADGETTDLGTVTLSHYHEQQISEPPAPGRGTLVVGNKTDNAIRLVDLASYSLVEAVNTGSLISYDFQLVDSRDEPIDGTLCNVIPGPDNTVFAIFTANGLRLPELGYAVHFDPVSRRQVSQNVVRFPAGTEASAGPCRAIFHEHNGQQYLFAVAADSSNQGGQKGFWYANIGSLASGDVTATLLEEADDPLFDKPLHNVAAYRNQVFIGTETAELSPCDGHACAFIADFDTSGHPNLRKNDVTGTYEIHRAGLMRGDVQLPELGNQTVSCADVEFGVEYFGLTVATFKKTGQDLLIFGNCHSIDMFDLADGTRLDFDPVNAGRQGLNAALFGGGFYHFALSPDGNTLWSVPANKSRIHHSSPALEPVGEVGDLRITLDRHAALPIDLSATAPGDVPSVDARFATTDRDGFEGVPADGIADHRTPAIDPGIDVRGHFLKAYYAFWNKSLSGSLPNPLPFGPTIAVGTNTLWVRGTGADTGDAGQSGLGVGGNLSVLDLDAQRLVLWTPPGHDYYPPFVGLKQHVFGFDLTPERDTMIATAGLVYIP